VRVSGSGCAGGKGVAGGARVLRLQAAARGPFSVFGGHQPPEAAAECSRWEGEPQRARVHFVHHQHRQAPNEAAGGHTCRLRGGNMLIHACMLSCLRAPAHQAPAYRAHVFVLTCSSCLHACLHSMQTCCCQHIRHVLLWHFCLSMFFKANSLTDSCSLVLGHGVCTSAVVAAGHCELHNPRRG
jgi:hypothetical protein